MSKHEPLSDVGLPDEGVVVWVSGITAEPEIAWLYRDAGQPARWDTPHLGQFEFEIVTSWEVVSRPARIAELESRLKIAESDTPSTLPCPQCGKPTGPKFQHWLIHPKGETERYGVMHFEMFEDGPEYVWCPGKWDGGDAVWEGVKQIIKPDRRKGEERRKHDLGGPDCPFCDWRGYATTSILEKPVEPCQACDAKGVKECRRNEADRRKPQPTPSAGAEEIVADTVNRIIRLAKDEVPEPDPFKLAREITAALTEHAVPLEAEIARLREAGEWVLNVVNGVSRGGGGIDPNDDEPETAFAALHTALKGD